MKRVYLLLANVFLGSTLFMNAQQLTSAEQSEIAAHQAWLSMKNIQLGTSNFGGIDYGTEDVHENIIPTAGATQTFSPNLGDHFYDPGGPGGSTTGSTPGNYPNCGCMTQTILLGVSQLKFHEFSVFATFDYVRIYDGVDATGTLLFRNDTGPFSNVIDYDEFVAAIGGDTITASSGNFYFEFYASTVVDYAGWDAEVVQLAAPLEYCEPELDCTDNDTILNVTFQESNNP